MEKSKLLTLVVTAGIFFAKPVYADFSVNGSSSHHHYGNASNVTFKKAIEGNDMTDAEIDEVTSILPAIDTNVAYGRVSFHMSKGRLGSLKNKSLGTNASSALSQKVKKDSGGKGIEVAIGKVWNNWRTEVEYLVLDDVKYNPSPAFVGGGTAIDSNIKSHVFLANAYYEVLDHEILKPYVMFGAGFARNEASTTFGSNSKSKVVYGPALTFGIGTRVKLIEKFYLDLAWRYAYLGNFTIYDGASTKLKGTRSMTAVSVGLNFLFN